MQLVLQRLPGPRRLDYSTLLPLDKWTAATGLAWSLIGLGDKQTPSGKGPCAPHPIS